MVRSAILLFVLNHSVLLFSQQPVFSRIFETKRKNVALAIINNHSNYFHVLRYNKEVHDMTLERRGKPSAEILAFTPLKLDSVNSNWFNYSHLDYLIYEANSKVYFCFEKVLNNKKEIYLKVIDTTGRSSGFIQLAILDYDQSMEDFDFEFKITADNKLLIIGAQHYLNQTSKKFALLYDLERREKIWVKRLPQESWTTGSSQSFECNEKGDLFYTLVSAEIVSFKRKYLNHSQTAVPVYYYHSLTMASLLNGSNSIRQKEFAVNNLSGLNSIFLFPDQDGITALVNFSKLKANEEEGMFFLVQKWRNDLETDIYSKIYPLKISIKEQLTFYDGSDQKSASDKKYDPVRSLAVNGIGYTLSERKENNYYKELLLVKADLSNGDLLCQELVPRKINYYDDQIRFSKTGMLTTAMCNGGLHSILLENKRNFEQDAQNFRYQKFSKQGGGGGNVVSYLLRPDGSFVKKLLFENEGFQYIPLVYQSNQCDFVYYLNRGKAEKFAILKLNPF